MTKSKPAPKGPKSDKPLPQAKPHGLEKITPAAGAKKGK